ncbi:MAG: transposase [Dongiaceae bacterium]
MDTSGSRRRPYRTWPASLKREIVEASFAPGMSASVVARRYEVNTNQLFTWRKQYRDGLLGSADPGGPALVPVRVAAEPGEPGAAPQPDAGRIEIELAGGYRVRVGTSVDGGLLRLVLDVLERR